MFYKPRAIAGEDCPPVTPTPTELKNEKPNLYRDHKINLAKYNDTNLKISPNPFESYLRVDFKVRTPGEYRTQVMTLHGQVIYDQSIQADAVGEYSLLIGYDSDELLKLRPGTYFVILRSDEGITTQKVIKL